jgi:hypothetical protein
MWWLAWGVAGVYGLSSLADNVRDDADSITVGLTPATLAALVAVGAGVYYLKKKRG